ncbi:LacI family DNA-binding transcriptional regulator [Salsuginibacillus kocurii]|uniref:LacI family DNA-binding transcriptional regulator n=1 Tax=Salsuginibacillus kocurii TaxID=427078 RepID=UPI00036AEBCE|nr:LacI family DNA-binding transcriptional regulator [Salsuginibacillus kocurii]
MKPTIYHVAEQAGVSIATVSKVINNTGRIGRETRENVLAIMKELGYEPSVVASALTGKHTNTIGLLVPDVANPYFSELARRIEDRGHEKGFSVVICNTDNGIEKEAEYVKWLHRKQVDGIILGTGIQDNRTLHELLKQETPTALVARDSPSLQVDTVRIDDYLGGRLATEHLLELGHTNLGFMLGGLNSSSEEERLRGVRSVMTTNNLSVCEKDIVTDAYTIEEAKQQAMKILTQAQPPTAIFAMNDLLANGVMKAARELGLRLPQDISVIGFDNTLLASISEPPLTTIAQPIADLGTQVTDLLVQEILGEKTVKQRIVLLPSLVVRESTTTIARTPVQK